MEIPVINTIEYSVPVFWDDEFKYLDYIQEPFNDPVSVNQWINQGYQNKITGDLCDMRHRLPVWAESFTVMYQDRGWKNIGLAFYRMRTGTVIPVHRDLYQRYIEIFNLQGQEYKICRALVLLENWKPGHYLEVNGVPYVNWSAGKTVEWVYDTPHSAANIGLEDRYTLQITGLRE